MAVSVIEQAKIQAQVLVPLVKALQAELGEEKANRLVRKALGEPELGFLLVCTADFAVAEGFGSDVKLTRTQTIMQGASHCDFRYRRVKPAE